MVKTNIHLFRIVLLQIPWHIRRYMIQSYHNRSHCVDMDQRDTRQYLVKNQYYYYCYLIPTQHFLMIDPSFLSWHWTINYNCLWYSTGSFSYLTFTIGMFWTNCSPQICRPWRHGIGRLLKSSAQKKKKKKRASMSRKISVDNIRKHSKSNVQQWVRLRYWSNFAGSQFFLFTRGVGLSVNQKSSPISASSSFEQLWCPLSRGATTPWQWQISFRGSDHRIVPVWRSNLSWSLHTWASATMEISAGIIMFKGTITDNLGLRKIFKPL